MKRISYFTGNYSVSGEACKALQQWHLTGLGREQNAAKAIDADFQGK